MGPTARAQIAAGALSVGVLTALAIPKAAGAKRVAVAIGAASVAGLLGGALASYVARRRCEAIYAALLKLERGEELYVDEYLRAAIVWLFELKIPTGDGTLDDFWCWAYPRLMPYITELVEASKPAA